MSQKVKEQIEQKTLSILEREKRDKILSHEAFLKRKSINREIRALITNDYPISFNLLNPQPLALGIHHDVFKAYPQFSKKAIRIFLGKWVKHPLYRKNLKERADRLSLDGVNNGSVLSEHIKKYNYILKNEHLLLTLKDSPLTLQEFKTVEELSEKISYEEITSGDAGDKHQLKVGRFRRDVEFPTDLDNSSDELMKIINSIKMQKLYQKITGFKKVCIRRAQSNYLKEGDYVGIHIDGEGDEKYKGTHIDYKFAVVLHFKLNYTGGDTVLYPNDEKLNLQLPEYSMLVITGALPHEVEPVKTGIRRSLVYFLSDNFGPSQK